MAEGLGGAALGGLPFRAEGGEGRGVGKGRAPLPGLAGLR